MQAKTQEKFLVAEAISGAVIGALCGAALVSSITFLLPSGLAIWLVAISAILFGAAAARIMGTHPQDWHSLGMEYIDDIARATSMLQEDETAMMTPTQKDGRAAGVKIAGVELSRKRETAHQLLVGLPGGGKTVVINNVLLQIVDRGDRAIIHDPKGEFSSWLPASESVLLGPWDTRAAVWDIAADISNPESARTWMESVMLAGVDNPGQNKFFYDTARDLGAGLIQYYQRTKPGQWGFQDLNKDINGTPADLVRKAARGNPSIQSAFPGLLTRGEANNAENNAISTFRNGVAFVQNYALAFEPDAPKFSIRDFMRGVDRAGAPLQTRFVILNNNAIYKTASEAIFSGILSIAAQMAASAEMEERSADARGLWFVLDEYPQLGESASASIQTIEELGRSRGVRVLKAMQDYSQVYQRAGKEKGQAQLSVQQTRLFCKVSPETAAEISKTLDKREIARLQSSALTGHNSKTIQISEVAVLRPSDLMDLKAPTADGKGVEMIMMKDGKIGKLFQTFPPPGRIKAHSQPYIERRAWVEGLLDYVDALDKETLEQNPPVENKSDGPPMKPKMDLSDLFSTDEDAK